MIIISGFLIALENPLDAISIIKLSIRSEWHIMQLLKSVSFGAIRQSVKNDLQFVIFPA